MKQEQDMLSIVSTRTAQKNRVNPSGSSHLMFPVGEKPRIYVFIADMFQLEMPSLEACGK